MNPNFAKKFSRLKPIFAPAVGVFLSVCAATAQDKITIRGSNTIGEELAPRLIAEYKTMHKEAAFDLEFKGSGYGIGALMGGYCDIAGSSKAISKEQDEIAQIRKFQFKEYILGAYAVSILVNSENPVSNLTSNQVLALFTGKIQNWKEVGGADAPVHLLIRDPVSGTYLGFKELAMANLPYAQQPALFPTYEAIVQAVAKDPSGIGYSSLDLAKHDGVKGVSIGIVYADRNLSGRDLDDESFESFGFFGQQAHMCLRALSQA